MSGIGSIPAAEAHKPVEKREEADRDGGRKPAPRRLRKQESADDMVEVEQHSLDVEA